MYNNSSNNNILLYDICDDDSIRSELNESNESIDINKIEEEKAFKEYLNIISYINNQSQQNFNDNSLLFKEEEEDINDNVFLYKEEKEEDNIEDLKLIGLMNDFLNNNKNISNNKTNDNSNKNMKNSFSFNTISKSNMKFKCKKNMEKNKNKIREIMEENKDFKFNNFLNHNNYNNLFIDRSFPILELEENKECDNTSFNNMKNTKVKNSSNLNNFAYSPPFSMINFEPNNFSFIQKNNIQFNSFIINNSINNKIDIYNNSFNIFGSIDKNKDNTILSQKRKRSPNNKDKNKMKLTIDKKNNKNGNIMNNISDINCNINKKIILNFSMNQNNNKMENILFNIKKNNCGRKKKDSGQIGKHKKTDADNMLRKIKSLTFKIIFDIINDELKNINNEELNKNFLPAKLLQINQEQTKNTTKIFNLGLLNKSFKSIFSEKVTGRYNNKENHNRDLINKLYEINKKGI